MTFNMHACAHGVHKKGNPSFYNKGYKRKKKHGVWGFEKAMKIIGGGGGGGFR